MQPSAGPALGGDHVSPSGSVVSRHKSVAQRMQEEMVEARTLEVATKPTLANVRNLGAWENLSPAERAMKEIEIDERQRAQARLNGYGPGPLSYEDLYCGTPEKYHG